MKIYPSSHNIKEVSKLELRDVPLAYIDTSNTEQYINITKEPIFTGGYGESIIRAYEEFDNPEAYLFNSDNQIIKNLTLKRLGNRYVYEPRNAVEFTPLRFSFDALIKKNMTYQNDKHYNLKVAVHEETEDMMFSKQLIAIFGDAPRRGLCPSNISVNNQSMTPDSLINASYKGNDILFIKSPDGAHYKETVVAVTTEPVAATMPPSNLTENITDGNTTTTITTVVASDGVNNIKTITTETTTLKELDMNMLLSSNTNVWLSVETFGDMIHKKDNTKFRLTTPVLYTTTEYSVKDYEYCFRETSNLHPNYPSSVYNYSYSAEESGAVLILEKPSGGFVIVTHKVFFDNLYENVNLLYELIMQVFLKAYYRTNQLNSWITDRPVDYIAYKSSKYNLKHAEINLNNMLKNDNYDIGGEFTLLEVATTTPDVIFVSMNPDKDMFFFKISTSADPVKNEENISVYTSRHSVIHYKQEVIKKIESGLDIITKKTDTGLYLTVLPCHSTQRRINTMVDITLRIEDPRLEYVLCCKPGTTDITNDFVLIPANDFTVLDGLKVATVRVASRLDAKTFDIRLSGGGLPLDSEPDYNMLDIGHINGRPYRVGSMSIIKLPARLKEHDEKIRLTIDKHASSGDHFVIVYE